MAKTGMLRPMTTSGDGRSAGRNQELHKFARGALHQGGLLDRAASALRQTLAANPQDLRTLLRLGDICRMQGRFAEAHGCYSRVSALQSGCRKAAWLSAMLNGDELPHAPPPGCWPVPFARIENFLTPAEHDQVLNLAIAKRSAFAPGKVGAGPTRRVQPARRVGLVAGGEACADIAGWFVRKVRKVLPGALSRLRLDPALPAHIDLQMTAFQDSGYSRPHQDPSPREYRSQTPLCIYYFHRQPRAFQGGDLLLYDTDVNTGYHDLSAFSRIEPIDNSFVIYPRVWFHEVTSVQCAAGGFADGRFTVNCLWPRLGRTMAKERQGGSMAERGGAALNEAWGP